MDDLLTTRQLQELLQVDRITIYRMLNDGRLHGFKVGGQWRFSRREIERWLEGQRANAQDSEELTLEKDDDLLSAQALPMHCIQAMQSVYAEALDVAAVTVDLDGTPLTDVSNSCDFCALVLASEEGRRRCAASWQRVGSGQTQACHAGILCVGSPVEVGGRWAASAASCQFVLESSPSWLENLPGLAAKLGLEEEQLRAAAGSVRVIPEQQLPRIVRLLARVADTLGEIGQERAMFVERLHRIAEMTNL